MDKASVSPSGQSVNLSRTLDNIGLNDSTIKYRRDNRLFPEAFHALAWDLCSGEGFYFFGSQIEGTTTIGLNSDIDFLIVMPEMIVIQELSCWKPGKCNLLVLQEDTVPGYCRLQLMRPDAPLPCMEIIDYDKYIYDDHDRVIRKPVFETPDGFAIFYTHSHGPAQCAHRGTFDVEAVCAYKCDTWLKEADEWINRRRSHNWPTQSLIQKAFNDGFFVVPVGYNLSKTKELEWRISFSLAERHLLFSLDTVHLKVNVVLKMLIKQFIKPHVGESISSYHCKTALFYCTEETDSQFWRKDNLLNCITLCLNYLLRWVQDGNCPHYILPKLNLFAGKVTRENRILLVSILQHMSVDVWRFLIQLQVDDLGQLLTTGDPVLHERLIKQSSLRIRLSCFCLKNICKIPNTLLRVGEDINSFICSIRDTIWKLCSLNKHSDEYKQRAINVLHQLLHSLLGSLLSSRALSQQEPVPEEAFESINMVQPMSTDIQLKLASILYCSGEFQKAKSIFGTIDTLLKRRVLHTFCKCCHNVISVDTLNQIILLSDNEWESVFINCVQFTSHERYCLPQGMQYELYKAAGDDKQHRLPFLEDWMGRAVADSVPYFYYLQYLNQGKLGQSTLQQDTLKRFVNYIRDKRAHQTHIETSWNLLGLCYEQEQKPEVALQCYRKSLQVRLRNNVAKWHLSTLLYKLTQQP